MADLRDKEGTRNYTEHSKGRVTGAVSVSNVPSWHENFVRIEQAKRVDAGNGGRMWRQHGTERHVAAYSPMALMMSFLRRWPSNSA